jgi:hypothetical protein
LAIFRKVDFALETIAGEIVFAGYVRAAERYAS